MDKLKVLIVDDEPLVSEIILDLVKWEENGFYDPKVAFNGRDALKIYEAEKPDVVITDIYMPVIDGIELSKQILKQNKRANIIMLTVSEKFECIKEALELGVFSYLLKYELNTENLEKCLHGIQRKIKQEQKLKKSIVQSFFYELFCGQTVDIEELKSYEYSNDTIKLAFLLIQKGEEFQVQTGSRKEQKEFGDKLQLKLEEYSSFLYLTRWEHEYIVAGIGKTEDELEVVKDFGKALTRELEQQSGYAVLLFCQPCGWKEAKDVFSKMQLALEYHVFLQKNQLLEQKEFGIISGDVMAKTDGYLNVLKEKFFNSQQNLKEIKETINEMFDTISKNYDLKSFSKACMSLKEDLEIGKKDTEFLWDSLENKIKKTCWYDVQKIKEWFLVVLEEICSPSEETIVLSKRMGEILKYIQVHYAEDLSADSVAEVFHISSVYLHQQFKKEVSDTFLNYLTGVRMENAKILLQYSKYKVNIIAEKVGYHSSQYFSQIFKKYVGCTPLEFRE